MKERLFTLLAACALLFAGLQPAQPVPPPVPFGDLVASPDGCQDGDQCVFD